MQHRPHEALPAQAVSHQASRSEEGLLGLQLSAGGGDVRTILLGGA